MKKILLFLLPTLLFSCIWLDGTTIDGTYKELSGYSFAKRLQLSIRDNSPQTKLEEVIRKKASTTKLTDERTEDDAVISMLKGDYNSSIKLLLALNKKNPSKYSIASNLGTAYELNGENEKALEWITEGIKRDPNSHYGTEWLHQLILKTKIEQEKNPDVLKTKRVIPIPEQFTFDKNLTIDGKEYSITDIKIALQYQLQERTIFVKPKESIVADLLFTSAEIEAETSTLEEALDYLELAELYGFSDPKLLEETRAFYQEIIDHPEFSYHIESMQNPTHLGESIFKIVLIVAFLIMIILLKRLIGYVYKKIKKEKSE